MNGEEDVASRAIVRSGFALGVRQMASAVIAAINLYCIIRFIGPALYGSYVIADGVLGYAAALGQTGIVVYLLRSPQSISGRHYNAAFTMALLFGLALLLVIESGHGLIAAWVRNPQAVLLLRVLALRLPVQALTACAIAKLEREMDFASVAKIETLVQGLGALLTLGLALGGQRLWAIPISSIVQALAMCVLMSLKSNWRPSLVLDRATTGDILKFALGYGAGDWIWELRSLVNPLLVGHFLGAAIVGQISLAAKITGFLSFARGIAWRLMVVRFGQLQSDLKRLAVAGAEASGFQVLTVGLPLLGFSLIAPILGTHVLGDKWRFATVIFPYMAVTSIVTAMCSPQSSALYAIRRNDLMFVVHCVNVAVLVTATYFAAPRLGGVGYGLAEIASTTSWVILLAGYQRVVGGAAMPAIALVWCLGLSTGLLWQTVSPLLLIAPVVTLLMPASVSEIRRYWMLIWTNVRARV